MRKKALFLAETGILLALLILAQFLTQSAGQIVTGACVNCILAVAALAVGWGGGLAVALVSPFAAFLLGIGPKLLPIVPVIALANGVLVCILRLIAGKDPARLTVWGKALAVLAASCGKFLLLYLIVVQLLCRVLPLKPPQIALFSTMFSYPQLITALIGTVLAFLLLPAIRRVQRTYRR